MSDSSTPFRPPESAVPIQSSSPFTQGQRIGAALVLMSEIALPLLLLAIGWHRGDIMAGIQEQKWWIGWLQLSTLGAGTWMVTVMPERAVMYLLRMPFVGLVLANAAVLSGVAPEGVVQVQGLANLAVVAALALAFRRLRMHRFANLSLASIVLFVGVEIVTRQAPILFVDRMGMFAAMMLGMHGIRIAGLARMVIGR